MTRLCEHKRLLISVDVTCTIRNTWLWLFPMLKLSAVRKRKSSESQAAASSWSDVWGANWEDLHKAQKCAFKVVNRLAAGTCSKWKKKWDKTRQQIIPGKKADSRSFDKSASEGNSPVFCLHICKFSVIQCWGFPNINTGTLHLLLSWINSYSVLVSPTQVCTSSREGRGWPPPALKPVMPRVQVFAQIPDR